MVNLLHQVDVIGASEWSKVIALKSSPVIIRVAARGIRTESGQPAAAQAPGRSCSQRSGGDDGSGQITLGIYRLGIYRGDI